MQVGLCEMVKSRSTIVRIREKGYTSLIIDPNAGYATVVSKAARLLHLCPEKCSLFHVNGCKIVNRDIEDSDGCSRPWSVAHSLQSTYSKHSSNLACYVRKMKVQRYVAAQLS